MAPRPSSLESGQEHQHHIRGELPTLYRWLTSFEEGDTNFSVGSTFFEDILFFSLFPSKKSIRLDYIDTGTAVFYPSPAALETSERCPRKAAETSFSAPVHENTHLAASWQEIENLG
ncbi:hypothetical protein RB195_006402 [Necator americanus]|uniref:Uncharacterized protein n=1 Tax=Necator americanus TaxID=51031 RepID=A0ABR1BTX2_NECAM